MVRTGEIMEARRLSCNRPKRREGARRSDSSRRPLTHFNCDLKHESFESCKNVSHRHGIEPDMVVLANVDELNRAGPIQHQRRGVRHPYLNGLRIIFQDAKLADQSTLRVRQKEDPLRQTEFIDEDARALVDLYLGHDPDDSQIGCRVEGFSQLHEPRLGIRSPIHAAFERDQDTMPEQIVASHCGAIQVDQLEFGKLLAN